MEVFKWIGANWLDLLQSLGIVSGFIFTAHTIRKESEARKIANLIALGESHHSIWKQLHGNPGLSRIRDAKADLDAKPLTDEEQVFVTSLVAHINRVYHSSKAGMLVRVEGMEKDITALLSLPIPKAVWESIKSFQDQDFVAFVEGSFRN